MSASLFLDGAIGPDRVHLDLDVPVEDFIQQHNLRIKRAPGNGHCLLYSWASATASSLTAVKQQVLHEYHANTAMYQQAGIRLDELHRYLGNRNYQLTSVDGVLNILCNGFQLTAFIIGQKFDYTDERNVVPIPGIMEIRRIASMHAHAVHRRILLLKTAEHYDCIV